MNRRHLLLGATQAAAVAAMSTASAADQKASPVQQAVNKPLLDAAYNCSKIAEVCLAHCQMTLSAGDTMLKDCSVSVAQLLPVCETLASLTAQGSKYLAKYAKFALEVCKDCEKECRKHESHHTQCKDCANACAACAKECQKIAA
jgi:Cys-rich four helix bundle protein (predicted Tat secretion target)